VTGSRLCSSAAGNAVKGLTTLAQCIAGLVREREANERALEATAPHFDLPPTPPELMVTYRGALGPLKVEVDADWIREMLPDFSPLSKQGRKLRRLLRIHEQHYARVWAAREASGIGPLIDERERIERDLKAAAEDVCDIEGSGAAHAALQAATLPVKGDGVRDVPAALLTLLEVAGTA
jgi:hypothetical protein